MRVRKIKREKKRREERGREREREEERGSLVINKTFTTAKMVI